MPGSCQESNQELVNLPHGRCDMHKKAWQPSPKAGEAKEGAQQVQGEGVAGESREATWPPALSVQLRMGCMEPLSARRDPVAHEKFHNKRRTSGREGGDGKGAVQGDERGPLLRGI